jgi:hypothetical protein
MCPLQSHGEKQSPHYSTMKRYHPRTHRTAVCTDPARHQAQPTTRPREAKPSQLRGPREARLADALGALAEAIGQSSVQLELDSQHQVKPSVKAYHPVVKQAGRLCETEFDRLMDKYHPKPKTTPPSTDQFSDEDLRLLGLERIK